MFIGGAGGADPRRQRLRLPPASALPRGFSLSLPLSLSLSLSRIHPHTNTHTHLGSCCGYCALVCEGLPGMYLEAAREGWRERASEREGEREIERARERYRDTAVARLGVIARSHARARAQLVLLLCVDSTLASGRPERVPATGNAPAHTPAAVICIYGMAAAEGVSRHRVSSKPLDSVVS